MVTILNALNNSGAEIIFFIFRENRFRNRDLPMFIYHHHNMRIIYNNNVTGTSPREGKARVSTELELAPTSTLYIVT